VSSKGAYMHLECLIGPESQLAMHCSWHEVVLDVRILHSFVTTNEPSTFEMVASTYSTLEHKPFQSSHCFGQGVGGETTILIESDWLKTFVLHIHFDMVLQVVTYFLAVHHHLDA
jgi:hypothetical protein